MNPYVASHGGHPPQTELLTGRAIFTDAYAVIPRGVQRDIVTSLLPGWDRTRCWILARPMTGFAETFSQMLVEVAPGGGSERGEPDGAAEGVLFVLEGGCALSLGGQHHALEAGGYAYLPAGQEWRLSVEEGATEPCRFMWVRKIYEAADGIAPPAAFVSRDQDVTPSAMPDTDGAWSTTRFVDPADLAHDMHVTIVNLRAGAHIPFLETHVMEHGLYVLQGRGVYRLNGDWVEVEAGDFMWLRAFCPQACYAGGPEDFRYLLYKDVNRFPKLGLTR